MRDPQILDLNDCTEFRQTVEARPPAIMHGAAVICVTLLGTALSWGYLTHANLVVRAPGRVRSVTPPTQVFNSGSGEVLSGSFGSRIVEVRHREGDVVQKGDVLVRLDTEKLDNEIARRERVIRAGEDELEKLRRMDELYRSQFETAQAKAAAELNQGRSEIDLEKQRRAADLRQAQAEVELSTAEEARLRKLQGQGGSSDSEYRKAKAQVDVDREKVARARLPVDESKLVVLERALVQVEKDYAVKQQEQVVKRAAKQAEVDGARLELNSLLIEKKQSVLTAPVAGVLTKGDYQVGDMLERGKAAFEIAEHRCHFEAELTSEDSGLIRAGMPVRIKLDAFDFQKYGTLTGVVKYVAPDSTTAEAPSPIPGLPAQKKIVFLVEVELDTMELHRGDYSGEVKLGMAGLAEIITDQESLLFLLTKKVRQSISLE